MNAGGDDAGDEADADEGDEGEGDLLEHCGLLVIGVGLISLQCLFYSRAKPNPKSGLGGGSHEGEVVNLDEGRLNAVDDEDDDATTFEHGRLLIVA